MMKLSNREKFLIGFLVVLVIVYLIYSFGLNKINSIIDGLKIDYEQISQEYDNTVNSIIKKSEDELKYKALNYKVGNLTKGYLNEIKQENLIVYLNKLIVDNNINIGTINYSDVTEQGIGDTENQSIVKGMTFNFSFTSKYEDMLKFIDELQSSELNFIVSNINFLITEDNLASVTMSASIYAIDFVDLEEYKDIEWKDVVEFGKNNPFVGNSLNVGNNSNNEDNSTIKYDFVMTLKPTSSDLPTIVFGKTKLEDTNSYIFDDENAIKDIVINFKSEAGKYYFQYSTSRNLYPVAGDWMEFSPENAKSIAIKIYSSPRNSANDASGANIKIDNKTDVIVDVYIENDDTTRPRAIFESKKGISIK